ncbi:hypothetical protein [Roseimaritima sediminicola]|uniref:hypothetical protein n=1 Tax=Roseimaritima sediminicola TaxID=2662066 RepID=UPI00129848D9|nr:hypothetical protein [Roseimaritima sediminicola]
MTKILIGALACHAYPERRRRCLEAWVADALRANMDVVFLLGGADDGPRREGLNLLLPCPDDYESLTQKSRGLFEWALAQTDCDFVFKCDDDTYLRPDRLLRLAQLSADYVGAEWTEGSGYGSGGAGYLLSRKAAKVAAVGLADHPQGVEDLLVGEILKSAGIEMTRTDDLIAYANDSARPKPTNSIISAHAADDPWKSHAVEFAEKLPFVTCEPMGRLGNLLFQAAAVLGYRPRLQ